jgi:hypothetical protein
MSVVSFGLKIDQSHNCKFYRPICQEGETWLQSLCSRKGVHETLNISSVTFLLLIFMLVQI